MATLPSLAFKEVAAQSFRQQQDFVSHLWGEPKGSSVKLAGLGKSFSARCNTFALGKVKMIAFSSTPFIEKISLPSLVSITIPYFGSLNCKINGEDRSCVGGRHAILHLRSVGEIKYGLSSSVRIVFNEEQSAEVRRAASHLSKFDALLLQSTNRQATDPNSLRRTLSALLELEREFTRTILSPDRILVDIVKEVCRSLGHINAAASAVGHLVPVDERLQSVIDAIEADLSKPLTLDQMCAIAGMSRRALQYAFKSAYGVSPTGWQSRERLNRAYSRLLNADTSHSVADIGLELGFNSASSFSTRFRDLFGFPPSDLKVSRQSPHH